MRVAHHGKLFNVQRCGNLGKLCVYTTYSVNEERKKNYLAFCVPEYGEVAYTVCMSCHVNLTPGVWMLTIANLAYRQHSALSYVCESGVPILYHEFKSIPWLLSIP